MKCNEIEEYLDGALTGSRLTVFEEHLDGCRACTLELRRQEQLDRALAAAARELPPAPARLLGRLKEELEALERRQRTLTRWKFAAAILIVGIGIGLGSLLDGDGRRGEDAEPAPEVTAVLAPEVLEMIPNSRPVASVVLGDGSSALAVPVATSVNATIVFVYPVLDGRQTHDGAE